MGTLQKKKTSASAANVLLSFVIAIFLSQMIELSQAANPTIAMQDPINESIYLSPFVFDLPMQV
jgi:hypothetical protein